MVANIDPSRMSDMVETANSGNFKLARDLQNRLPAADGSLLPRVEPDSRQSSALPPWA